jgi:protein-S-isoprenylcysteine O-methyltransferase Ste14
MSNPRLLEVLRDVWSVFGVYWVAVGMRAKAAQTHEVHWYRITRLAVLLIVFLLLFWRRTAIGFLGRPFLPDIVAITYVAFAFTIAGLAIALWARIHLGQYWSDKVVLQSGHQLIRTGPYAYMRHPVYSGVLLGVLGTALLLGEWRGLLAFMVLLMNYAIKAKKEERILAERFPVDFQEHLSQAGFFLPRLRH